MKKQDDMLNDALNALKNEPIPPGPPQELIDATMENLNKARGQPQQTVGEPIRIVNWLRTTKFPIKAAVAAALFIVAGTAGYVGGRLSTPPPPGAEQLQAALEPAIRQNLLEDMSRYWQVSLTNSYTRLKDELSEQYRRDIDFDEFRQKVQSFAY